MAQESRSHIQLILRSYPKRDYAKVWVKEPTAQFFGWLDHFETYTEMVKREMAEGKRVQGVFPRQRLMPLPGKPIRISRDPHPTKLVAGKNHVLRIGRLVTNAALAELAHFTNVNWYWMEDVGGTRRTRQQWEAMYSRLP